MINLTFRQYLDIAKKFLDAKSELIAAIYSYFGVHDLQEFYQDNPSSFQELFLDDIFFT